MMKKKKGLLNFNIYLYYFLINELTYKKNKLR